MGKKNCQIFTPNDYVNILLDKVDYKKNLYGKKILENACGDGNVLASIVERYILDCRKNNIQDSKIIFGLENDIYAVEIDKYYYEKCLQRLNGILKKEKLGFVNWKVFNEDYLKKFFLIKFEYIVSNPPYITYRYIEEKDKVFIRYNFSTCSEGKFDYCYAFIEKSYNDLSTKGKMSYLIPISVFKTVFGEKIRDLIKNDVKQIIDYSSLKVFSNVLVSSAILVVYKNKNNNYLTYVNVAGKEKYRLNTLSLVDKWVFSNYINQGTHRFGDFFQVSHVVATLYNKAYILTNWEYDESYYYINDYAIEAQLVRDSSSPRSMQYGRVCKIIFPYYYENNVLKHYSLQEFETRFPQACNYLNTFRKKLDNRKKDDSAMWFEYGRSQALRNLNQSKLLFSTIITDHIHLYDINCDNIPYSGLFVYLKENIEYNLDDARRILESYDFFEYVQNTGIPVNGKSVRITSKDIMNFKFTDGRF